MGASSATGTGLGSSNKPTAGELSTMSLVAPAIYVAGSTESNGALSSPPSPGNIVHFPFPLPGGPDKYAVILTGQGTGAVFVVSLLDNDSGFTGFILSSEEEGTVFYIVVKKGARLV